MKKLQKTWPDVAKELHYHLCNCTLSHAALSAASGVNYYAIRRFRKTGIHNDTDNATKLCTYFNIEIKNNKKVQNTELDKLVSALTDAWDGSESHAQLLTKLIRSTKSFRVEGRCK